MELSILGSSSYGNCYILQNENEALIIEAGINFTEVKKALDFNLSKVVGCIISHEHGDHSKYVNDFLNARIKVYASAGTVGKLNTKSSIPPLPLEAGNKLKLGNFTILPFDVMHDCAEPFGFVIKHEETGNILFVTDSYYVPVNVPNLSNILIEANYCDEILERNFREGKTIAKLRDRTIESHMSIKTCKEALLANDLSKVNNIVLIHLSDRNSHAEEFRQTIYRSTGKAVYVADKGMKLNFNKSPF